MLEIESHNLEELYNTCFEKINFFNILIKSIPVLINDQI